MKWMGVSLCLLGCAAAWADSAFVDFDRGLIHPAELGGMPCERVEKYNDPSLGYTVFYQRGDTFSAEVSVLTYGRDAIETGAKADGIEMVFEAVEMLQERAEESGIIGKVSKRGATVVPSKGDLRFASRVYQFNVPRVGELGTNSVPRIASVYVTGAKNAFVKIEFRFDVAEGRAARAMADQLVKQQISMLRAEPSPDELLLAACDAAVYNPADHGGRAAAQRVFARARSMGELNIYDALFVWPRNYGKPENADLLVAAYFAGMLQVVLPAKAEAGGEYEAFAAMLTAYEAMRARDDIDSIPRLDEWLKAPDRAALYQSLLVEFGYAAAAE